jgi:hypothetical protein
VTSAAFRLAVRVWLIELERAAADVAASLQGRTLSRPSTTRARRTPARPDQGCRRTFDPACHDEANAVTDAPAPASSDPRTETGEVLAVDARRARIGEVARRRLRAATDVRRVGTPMNSWSSTPTAPAERSALLHQGTTDRVRPPPKMSRGPNLEPRAAARQDREDQTAESVATRVEATPTSPAERSGTFHFRPRSAPPPSGRPRRAANERLVGPQAEVAAQAGEKPAASSDEVGGPRPFDVELDRSDEFHEIYSCRWWS